jgi:hypothetical protein
VQAVRYVICCTISEYLAQHSLRHLKYYGASFKHLRYDQVCHGTAAACTHLYSEPNLRRCLMQCRVWNKLSTTEHFTAGSWWQAKQSVTPFNTFMVAVITGLSFFYCSLANHILGVFYCLRLDSNAGSSVTPTRSCSFGIVCTVATLHFICRSISWAVMACAD